MSQATLRDVTLKTVANYGHAAEQAIDTYRAGGQRLIAAMQQGVERATERGAGFLVPKFVAAVRQASKQFGTVAGKGLDAISWQTGRVVEFGKAGVTAQVERVASFTERFDNRIVVTGVEAAVRLSLPGAQAALKVSERVAANADRIHGSVVAEKPAKARAAKPAKAKKAVKKAVATVKRAPRKAAVEAAPVKAVRVRRARKVEAPAPAAEAAA